MVNKTSPSADRKQRKNILPSSAKPTPSISISAHIPTQVRRPIGKLMVQASNIQYCLMHVCSSPLKISVAYSPSGIDWQWSRFRLYRPAFHRCDKCLVHGMNDSAATRVHHQPVSWGVHRTGVRARSRRPIA
ncbi:hypothetical protein AC579_1452 [Pseudocercospora musae]|uniref:Uncharacterized protein n=1 Tax=Pseudocercospora musae TaxID=113226 RepID=A0A139IN09_9PEZI|nr:hypothetical protein AC579_1452 [Pseudocercospora musae]